MSWTAFLRNRPHKHACVVCSEVLAPAQRFRDEPLEFPLGPGVKALDQRLLFGRLDRHGRVFDQACGDLAQLPLEALLQGAVCLGRQGFGEEAIEAIEECRKNG